MHNNSRRRRNLSPFSERHKIETLVWDFISCWREHKGPRANQLNRFFFVWFAIRGKEAKENENIQWKVFHRFFPPTMMMRIKGEKFIVKMMKMFWSQNKKMLRNSEGWWSEQKWFVEISMKKFRCERNIFNLVSKEFKLPALETWIITSQCKFVANCEKLILIFKLRRKLRARLFLHLAIIHPAFTCECKHIQRINSEMH